jgi:chromosome segregation ATPase
MLDHGCMQSSCPGCVRDDASHQCKCEWTCRCHECRDDRDGQNYVFDKDYAKILWEKNNFIAEQQVDLDRMPKKHQEDLAFYCDMYESDAGGAMQANYQLNEKLTEYEKKLSEYAKTLTDYEKKLTESDSSLADYRVQVRCKNEELDSYNHQVKSSCKKHMETEKKLATSEARLIACQGVVHDNRVVIGLLRTQLDEAEEMRAKNYQKWKAAVSDAMSAQEPATKKRKEM